MNPGEIRVGVVGCGGFGLFMLQHLIQVPGVRLAGMAGTHREAAAAAARRFGMPEISSVEELVGRADVDLVYIATPPFLHHPQAILALEAGKHVLCEKPLALDLEQASEMISLAREKDLLLVANLMQRYSPLHDRIRDLVGAKLLGEPLHGYFENYAADEGLPPDHWFWDRDRSGGIFIEHAVHFFDLFEGWFGPGQVEAAQVATRPGSAMEDQAQCTVRYRDSVLVNFHHGFCQPGRMDRQEMRLVFERGDLTLHEWVPARVRIRALADEEGTRRLCDLFPGSRLDITAVYPPKDRACSGRHKPIDAYQALEMDYREGPSKMHLYGSSIRALVGDQIEWVRNRKHRRRVTEENGYRSLETAVAADAMAQRPVKGRAVRRAWNPAEG